MAIKPVWRPPTMEPDPFESAIYDSIRTRLPSVFDQKADGPVRFPAERHVLPGGEEAVIEFSAVLSGRPGWHGREAVQYALSGNAVRRSGGHRFEGTAIVDVKTRAFVELNVHLSVSTGPLARPTTRRTVA